MNWISEIKQRAEAIKDDLIFIRRHLHQYPELSFQEHQTTEFLVRQLEELGLEIHREYAETGVVAVLRGPIDGPVVALRGDIDALQVEEKTGLPFSSKNKGIMHACGHDAHTTIILGAARILTSLREHLSGTVKFILQPGEEQHPGGASIMIQNGVLENPKVDAIFGLHTDPRFKVGEIGYRYGVMMAEPDEFSITIHGKGGHASAPHLTNDPIPVAVDIIQAFQKIVSRLTAPLHQIVISVTKVHAGFASNVIPDTVEIAGTVRSLEPHLPKQIRNQMEKLVAALTSAYDTSYDFSYRFGYPVLKTDQRVTDFLVEMGRSYLGEEHCHEIEAPSFGGEDFAYYLEKVPGTFFRLGSGNPGKGIIDYLHSSNYQIDEQALVTGAGFMAFLAANYLERQVQRSEKT